MNFEKNRQEMLKKLSQMTHKKISVRPSKVAQLNAAGVTKQSSKPQGTIVVFGQKSMFRDNLCNMLRPLCTAMVFDESESAINCCMEKKPTGVILDMDKPTDWKMSTDIFTTLKMMSCSAKFLVCTADRWSTPTQTLLAQDAYLLAKPVSSQELKSLLL